MFDYHISTLDKSQCFLAYVKPLYCSDQQVIVVAAGSFAEKRISLVLAKLMLLCSSRALTQQGERIAVRASELHMDMRILDRHCCVLKLLQRELYAHAAGPSTS